MYASFRYLHKLSLAISISPVKTLDLYIRQPVEPRKSLVYLSYYDFNNNHVDKGIVVGNDLDMLYQFSTHAPAINKNVPPKLKTNYNNSINYSPSSLESVVA